GAGGGRGRAAAGGAAGARVCRAVPGAARRDAGGAAGARVRARDAAGHDVPVGAPAGGPPIGPHIVSPPQVGDGRLWVLPRPALPGEVADALYGQEEHKDSVAVHRLRAMVDSLNVIIDQEQRARQKPTWTTEVAGKTIGIDSQYIHVAGNKIPTAVLALLPITLPH